MDINSIHSIFVILLLSEAKKRLQHSAFQDTPTQCSPLNLSVDHRQVPVVPFGATNTDQKFAVPVEKKAFSNIVSTSKKKKKIAFQHVN